MSEAEPLAIYSAGAVQKIVIDLCAARSRRCSVTAAVHRELTCMQLHSNRGFLLYTQPKINSVVITQPAVLTNLRRGTQLHLVTQYNWSDLRRIITIFTDV